MLPRGKAVGYVVRLHNDAIQRFFHIIPIAELGVMEQKAGGPQKDEGIDG